MRKYKLAFGVLGVGVAIWVSGAISGIGIGILISQRGGRQ